MASVIVVDIGCYPHGAEESVYKLCDRFRPELLIGLDPYPDRSDPDLFGLLGCGMERYYPGEDNDHTVIVRRRVAAWTRTEKLAFRLDDHDGVPGIASGLTTFGDPDHFEVDAVDLGAILLALPGPLVLKVDAEGAEYVLLRDLHEREIDRRLNLVLVEWHPEELSHGMYVPPDERPVLRCPVEEWT